MRGIHFTVHMVPVAKGRPRFVRATGRTYTPKATENAEQAVRDALQDAYPEHAAFDTTLALFVEAYIYPPKTLCKKKNMPLIEAEVMPVPTRPDVDNYAKLVMDALNKGIAYRDDSLVAELHATKVYSMNPRLEVTIVPLSPLT